MSNDYPETDELPEPPKARPTTFIENEYNKALSVINRQAQEIATLKAELAGIDAVMARRPALDKPTRRENIEHAIRVAAQADSAERQVATLRSDLAALTAERDRLAEALKQARESIASEPWALTTRDLERIADEAIVAEREERARGMDRRRFRRVS